MYLHYFLLARPDFLVAQLTTESWVMFLLEIGGDGIRQHTVEWKDKMTFMSSDMHLVIACTALSTLQIHRLRPSSIK